MTKGKMRRLAVCAAAAVILAVTVLAAGPVRASQSGFAKISYEKMYLALNDVNNVIQAYQDTSDGSVAYCLNSALESPDGGQSYGNAGNGTGRISEAGMAAVRLVIGDGYPLNARYWTQRGIPEDAQRQATQLAIWAVLASLGEADSNADYFAYDYAVPINLQDVDAASMYRTLAGNALSGVQLPRSVSFGAAEISADASAGTVSVRIPVSAENLEAYTVQFSGLAEGTAVTLNGQPLASASWRTETGISDSREFVLSFPWEGNGGRTLALTAEGYGGGAGQVTVFEPDDPSYQTMGKVQKIGETYAARQETELMIPDEPGRVRLRKTDAESGEPLPGVEFGLYVSGSSEPVCLLETDEDGYALSGYLADGIYEIREVRVPEGYIRDTQTQTVTVQAGQIAESSWTNLSVKGSILLKKESGTESDPEQGFGDAVLSGAVYEVYDKETGAKAGEIITDENGEGSLTGLPLGTYLIKEIQPPEGHLASQEEYEAVLRYAGDETAVVEVFMNVRDEVIRQPVTLEKYAEDKPLPGAGFSFYLKSGLSADEQGNVDWDSAEPVVIGEQGETVLYTDENGRLTTIALPYGIYIIREVSVPEGYEACADMEIFVGESMEEVLAGEFLAVTAVDEKIPEETEPPTEPSTEPPTEPEPSEEPETPDVPETPAEKPAQPSEEAPVRGRAPVTGDHAPVLIWLLLLTAAGMVCLGAVYAVKRRKK